MSCLTVKSLLVQPFYEKHTDKILSEKNFIYEEKLKSPLSHSPLPLKTENLKGRKNFENSSKKKFEGFSLTDFKNFFEREIKIFQSIPHHPSSLRKVRHYY